MSTVMSPDSVAEALEMVRAGLGYLAAFTAGQGYAGDADYSPRAWLMHKTGITGGAAAAHTAWAGGCDQPAAACEVHHTRHKANGGKTSVTDCVLLCTFHHQIAIHRQGWTLVLNPDGTTTAWNTDKTTVLHSHGPPASPRHRPS